MKLTIHESLAFDSLIPLSEQTPEAQEHINNIAFDYRGANDSLSESEGDDTPGQPVRFTKLVHDIPTQEGPVIRTTVTWVYPNDYGTPAAFAAKSITIRAEVTNG